MMEIGEVGPEGARGRAGRLEVAIARWAGALCRVNRNPHGAGSPGVPAVPKGTVRVISLLPAVTEIVASLGMLDLLLGVSHECDNPEEVNQKPRVTHWIRIHGAQYHGIQRRHRRLPISRARPA